MAFVDNDVRVSLERSRSHADISNLCSSSEVHSLCRSLSDLTTGNNTKIIFTDSSGVVIQNGDASALSAFAIRSSASESNHLCDTSLEPSTDTQTQATNKESSLLESDKSTDILKSCNISDFLGLPHSEDPHSYDDDNSSNESESDHDILPGARRRRAFRSYADSCDENEITGHSDSEHSPESHCSEDDCLNDNSESIKCLGRVKESEVSSIPDVVKSDANVDSTELDADEDKTNPAYVPRLGRFYMHDHRQPEENAETIVSVKKKDDRRWKHDLFCHYEQAPKSTREIVNKYGYNIRQEGHSDRNFTQTHTNVCTKDARLSHPDRLCSSDNTTSTASERTYENKYTASKPIPERTNNPSRMYGRGKFTKSPLKAQHSYQETYDYEVCQQGAPRNRTYMTEKSGRTGHWESYTKSTSTRKDVNRSGRLGNQSFNGENRVNNKATTTLFAPESISFLRGKYQENAAVVAVDNSVEKKNALKFANTDYYDRVKASDRCPKRYSTSRQNNSLDGARFASSAKPQTVPTTDKTKKPVVSQINDSASSTISPVTKTSPPKTDSQPNHTTPISTVKNSIGQLSQPLAPNYPSQNRNINDFKLPPPSLASPIIYDSRVPINFASNTPMTKVYLPNQLQQTVQHYQPTGPLMPNYVLSNGHQQPTTQDYYNSNVAATTNYAITNPPVYFHNIPNSNSCHPNHLYVVPLNVGPMQPQWNNECRPLLGRRPLKPLEIKDPRDPSGPIKLLPNNDIAHVTFSDGVIKS